MTPNMVSAIEVYLITKLGEMYPEIPVIPSGVAVPKHASKFFRVWVLPSDDVTPTAIGGKAGSRYIGLVQVDVFGEKDIGAGPTGDRAFAVQKLLRRHPLEVPDDRAWMIFREASSLDMGTASEQHWHRVRVPYRYDVPNDALSA